MQSLGAILGTAFQAQRLNTAAPAFSSLISFSTNMNDPNETIVTEVKPKLITPSMLTMLNGCRMFQTKPVKNESMIRGTRLDSALRRAWSTYDPTFEGFNKKDTKALTYGYATLEMLAGKHCIPHDSIITSNGLLKVTIDDIPGVKGGPLDAASFDAGWGLDYKTGEIKDYTPQMAGYAYGCMRKVDAPTWLMYVSFLDHELTMDMQFTLGGAKDIIMSIVEKPMVPTRCTFCNWCALKDTCPQMVG